MQKFIILFSMLCLSIAATAQVPLQPQSIGGTANNLGYYQGALKGNKGLVFKSYPDTATANTEPRSKYTHDLFIRVKDSIFFRDTARFQWINLTKASAGNTTTYYGIDSIRVHYPNTICQYKNGDSICYNVFSPLGPTGGLDSVHITDSSYCQYKNGDSTCYEIINGGTIVTNTIDSVTVNGPNLCIYSNGVPMCVEIANTTIINNHYVDSITNILYQYFDQSISNNNSYNGIDSTTRLISGSIVIDSNYMVRWTDLVYQILGRVYTADAGQMQIPPAEIFGDKKTLIFGDTLRNVSYIEGPVSGQPVQPPVVDPASQIEFVMYDIRANTPFPVGISERWVYRNPINSWPVTNSTITGFSQSSTVAPFSDSMHIRIPEITNGQSFEKQLGSTLSTVGPTFLDLQLRLVATLPKAVKWNIVLYNDLVPVSSAVVLQDGSYGYSRTVIGSYKSVVIPWSEFSFPGGTLFNKIRFTAISSAASSIYIDDIRIQDGGGNTGGSSTGGIKSVNDIFGDHIYLEYGDTLTTSPDSSHIFLIHKRTGRVLGSALTYLTYIRSIDTCIIIDTVNSRNFTLRLNPNCRGSGSSIDTTSLSNRINDAYNEGVQINDSTWKLTKPSGAEFVIQYTGGVSGSSGGGFLSLGDGYGLTEPNDSTYHVDSSIIATRARLVNELALKLNISDTAAMLSPYKTSYPRQAVSLVFTTTGTSGAATATYSNSTGVFTFNVPQYSGGSGGVDSVRKNPISDSVMQYTAGTGSFAFRVRRYINIRDYGAFPSASAATNTTAINAAMVVAAANSAILYIPSGTYLVNSITYDPLVFIEGDGSRNSILQSASAVPLLSYTGITYKGYAKIKGVGFNGNSLGTIGIRLKNASYVNFDDIVLLNFTTYGTYFSGVYMGEVRNSLYINNATGSKGDSTSGSSIGNLSASNFIFTQCIFIGSTAVGVEWSNSTLLQINRCLFENNGTLNDAATGSIKVSTMGLTTIDSAVGLTVSYSDFKQTKGTTISINNGIVPLINSIENSVIDMGLAGTTVGVSLTGASIRNTLSVKSSKISARTGAGVFSTGAFAAVEVLSSIITTHSENSGSTYKDISNPLAIGAAVTSATSGSVLFAGVGGALRQDNTKLFYDSANNRLGIGTGAPDFSLTVQAANAYIVNKATQTTGNGEAGIQMQSYNGSVVGATGGFGATNSTWAFSGFGASSMYMYSLKSGGLRLFAREASSGIGFYTGGNDDANQRMFINSAGALRLYAYGAGTLTTDASGNVTATSDVRLKSNIHPYKSGLKELMGVDPITYSWNKKSGNETKGTYAGFSAQNVKSNIPFSTGVMPDGSLTLQDRAIMATMVNAIKELSERVEALEKENKILRNK